MGHDDKTTSNIETRLYDALRRPSQEAVEEDCGRVLAHLRQEAQVRTQENVVHFHRPSGATWRRLAVIPAAAAVILALLVGVLWQQQRGNKKNETTNEAKNDTSGMAQAADSSTVRTLADGSRIEERAGADVAVEPAPDGLVVRLNTGSIMVFAAKQAAGRHLYVQTRDLKVSVVRTIFLVKADDKGSRVAVIEGEVRVQQQGAAEKSVREGELVASNPKSDDLAFFLETGWSREAAAYLAKLHESMARSVTSRQSSSRGAVVLDKPRFEEASIRPCEQEFPAPEGARGGGGGATSGSIRYSPGRLDALCLNVVTLIRSAYRSPLNNNPPFRARAIPPRMNITAGLGPGEDGTRVRGGPDWVRSEKYTIAAVGDASADTSTLQDMLLELLERRFQLKLRVDVEEIPVYALKIAKDGLKLKPAEPGSCTEGSQATAGTPRIFDAEAERRALEALRRGGPPPCGRTFYVTGPNVMYVGGRAPLGSIANWLYRDSGDPLGALNSLNGMLVLDRTSIPETELFNYVLEIEADPAGTRLFGAEPDEPGVARAPNVFDALARLGLTLERTKDSREYIIIERIDRPTPN